MDCELDRLMWEAWMRVREKVLGDPEELHRRLERRERMYEAVPRALCFAIRASDRRINEMNAWLSARHAMEKGHEVAHEVQITSQLVRDLCRPVEPYWGQRFRDLAREMGCREEAPRALERRGALPGRRVRGLGGQRGPAVPLVDGLVPAMASKEEAERCGKLRLDPGARGYTAPDGLLVPYWLKMVDRLPDGFEQMVRRKVRRWTCRDGREMTGWVWECPGCGRDVWTLYLPAGSPDWAAAHGIELPEAGGFCRPEEPRCLACHRCHGLFGISWTEKTMTVTWSKLIGHMSGGLLYGREVERPASFGVVRKKVFRGRRKRASPRRDELERYLVGTELTTEEIARRMGWMRGTVQCKCSLLCRLRRVKGRAGLRKWWAKRRAKESLAAA